MQPTNKRQAAYTYPINFISPLPVEECANRLRSSFGNRMGFSFATMQGFVEQIDENIYQFELYQVLQKGQQTIQGNLHIQAASQTLIEAVFEQERHPAWAVQIICIGVSVIIFAIYGQLNQLVAIASVILTIIGMYLLIRRGMKWKLPRQSKSPPISELLWYFERTLKS